VALAVECGVIGIWDFAAAARWDARFDAPSFQFLTEPGAVIATVGDETRSWRQSAEHEPGALVVAHLAFRQEQDERAALAVADGVELGVQPALGSPDTAGNIPFLSRLAAVRWAFRCVASIMMRSDFEPFASQLGENAVEHPHQAPGDEAIVERLVRAVANRRVLPL